MAENLSYSSGGLVFVCITTGLRAAVRVRHLDLNVVKLNLLGPVIVRGCCRLELSPLLLSDNIQLSRGLLAAWRIEFFQSLKCCY